MAQPLKGLLLAVVAASGACISACRASAQDGVTTLTTALEAAFHARVSATRRDGGRILQVTIDTTSSPELALRVAQFTRVHYDSVSTLDAIEVRFWRVEYVGAMQKTTLRRAGSFLPATLPTDTTPGWTEAVLAPSTPPPLATQCLRASDDTMAGGSAIGSLRDTVIDGRVFWRYAIQSRSTDVLTVDRVTLRPVDERFTDLAGSLFVTHYDGPHLTVTMHGVSGAVLTHDTTFAVAPYSATELDVLLQSMPLAAGYRAHIPVAQANSMAKGLDWITTVVTGIDSTRDAWVVDAAGTGTLHFSRHWVSRRRCDASAR